MEVRTKKIELGRRARDGESRENLSRLHISILFSRIIPGTSRLVVCGLYLHAVHQFGMADLTDPSIGEGLWSDRRPRLALQPAILCHE